MIATVNSSIIFNIQITQAPWSTFVNKWLIYIVYTYIYQLGLQSEQGISDQVVQKIYTVKSRL